MQTKLSPGVRQDLEALRFAPILINTDTRPANLPLAELRRGERGIGCHALTIFDTGCAFAFDQSHIFFDGAWGAALAEIFTDEALSWAIYMTSLPPIDAAPLRPARLPLAFEPGDVQLIEQAARATAEVSAETDCINLKAILGLRKLMKHRNDLLQLTVNDIFILYRAIHALTYTPNLDLVASLEELLESTTTRQAARAALRALDASRQYNPTIMIPIDASQQSPRDRLYPMTFEVPLADLNLPGLHTQTLSALEAYQNNTGDRNSAYATFDNLQRAYLAALAGFGAVMSQAKAIANTGESLSTGSIKMLAHLPIPLQRMLDQVPNRMNMLNDIMKGLEVFSNVGAVAPGSTLTRFITAKDDNEQKTLAWGVISDAQGVTRLSLRDFRPHVGLLVGCGYKDMAASLCADLVNTYALGLNRYVNDLHRITLASRETHLTGSPIRHRIEW
jgi:hypothetical protein